MEGSQRDLGSIRGEAEVVPQVAAISNPLGPHGAKRLGPALIRSLRSAQGSLEIPLHLENAVLGIDYHHANRR